MKHNHLLTLLALALLLLSTTALATRMHEPAAIASALPHEVNEDDTQKGMREPSSNSPERTDTRWVFVVVRDAQTGRPLNGASVYLTYWNMDQEGESLSQHATTRTQPTALYRGARTRAGVAAFTVPQGNLRIYISIGGAITYVNGTKGYAFSQIDGYLPMGNASAIYHAWLPKSQDPLA